MAVGDCCCPPGCGSLGLRRLRGVPDRGRPAAPPKVDAVALGEADLPLPCPLSCTVFDSTVLLGVAPVAIWRLASKLVGGSRASRP